MTFTKRCRPGTRYCSLTCYRSGPRPQRRTGEDRTCERCGTGFYVPASRVVKGEGRYCSLDCHNAAQGDGKTEHTCKTCGGAFRWSPSRSASGAYRITYCSLACRDADPERRAMLLEMNARQQLRRTTKAERLGYALLDGLGVEYLRQPVFGGKFTPDAAIEAPTSIVVPARAYPSGYAAEVVNGTITSRQPRRRKVWTTRLVTKSSMRMPVRSSARSVAGIGAASIMTGSAPSTVR